jgi:dTDP-4-dehydrorhamnose 3,5-epimerase
VRIEKTSIAGLFVIVPERYADDRGFFARSYCADEFRAAGLQDDFVQCNISFNHRRGTLRGMHYQAAPHGEVKLIRCTSGSIIDTVVDVRRGSPTHLRSFSTELSAENRLGLYVPVGFAHGFITLEDNTEVFYQMSSRYAPEYARGLRWNDSVLGLAWPIEPSVIVERDATYPDYRSDADYVE